MAPVKLLAVTIFLCIFTFSRSDVIFRSTEDAFATIKNKFVNYTKTHDTWYVLYRRYKERNNERNAVSEKLNCTRKSVKFFKINRELYLMLENEKYRCDGDLFPTKWRCIGVEGLRKMVTAYIDPGRIEYSREDYEEVIGVPDDWDRSRWELEAMADSRIKLVENTNC